ncbi:9852_t:CDS:2, partial [Gigaspora margarita]
MNQKVLSVIEKTQEDLKKDTKIQELWIKNICNHDKHAKFKIKETYNFIIVEAGIAGCVLARKLIHGIPNINILVLEAGGSNVHTNAFRLYDYDWGYVTQEQKMKSYVNPTKKVTVKKENPYPHGKARLSETVQYWVAQAFKALENNSRENPNEKFKQLHGFNSLHHVQDPHNRAYDIMSDLIDAVKNLGIPYNNDFNGEKQNGIRRFQ